MRRTFVDRNDVIPIALGARPEDYAAVAPPKSYIHVDDFESPKHLAEYLLTLDRNDDLYNEYFRWKGTGQWVHYVALLLVIAWVPVGHDRAPVGRDRGAHLNSTCC